MSRNLDSLESKRKVIARKLDSFGGYKAFHSGCVDNRKKGACQCRGAMLWVRSHISCRLIAAKNWSSCQMVAINVEGVLIISTYTIPGEDYVSEHAAKLYEFFTGLNWQGKWFIAGDFNEEFGGSWIATTSALLGRQQCDINCEASRWQGGKFIDYFITNAPKDLTACEVRYEKISHQIVETTLHIEVQSSNQMRQQKTHQMLMPKWLDGNAWGSLFQSCYQCGCALQWREVCHLQESNYDWSQQCADSQVDSDQVLVDYSWNLVMLKIVWNHYPLDRYQ